MINRNLIAADEPQQYERESDERYALRLARLAETQALAEMFREVREMEKQRDARRAASAKQGGFIIESVLIMLAMLATAAGALMVANNAEMRVREAQALSCARASDGTDSAIADCYTRRELSLPEGI
jgi:hypothetical protein